MYISHNKVVIFLLESESECKPVPLLDCIASTQVGGNRRQSLVLMRCSVQQIFQVQVSQSSSLADSDSACGAGGMYA